MSTTERASLETQTEAIRAAIERADANENPIERYAHLDRLYEELDGLEDDLTHISSQGEHE
jgi:acyl-CoA reductase-like NAD-dependent aldehyde dehydrogenase